MKICNGFVTNSSSTSYVISCKNGITKESFMQAFGVHDESLLYDLYEKLYSTIVQTLKNIPQHEDIDAFLESIYINDDKDKEEIKRRYLNGETVFYGKLTDSGDYGGMIEAFYSHESLIVIGDDIYLNLRNSVY